MGYWKLYNNLNYYALLYSNVYLCYYVLLSASTEAEDE